jgi:hypothetical protein
MAVVYSAFTLTALLGFVSFGVDWSHVELTKTQLEDAADAAAMAAAAQLPNVANAQSAAVTWGGYNSADDSAVVIDPVNDVTFGTWNSTTRTFTVLTGAQQALANAIQVTANRTASKGNAVQLSFARTVGMSTCDVHATSIALAAGVPPQITGLNGITANYGLFLASFNPANGFPSTSSYNSNAVVGCNGTIGSGGSNTIYGAVVLGPSGSASSITVTGSTTTRTIPVGGTPPVTFTPVANPSGISQTPNVTSNTTWPGGTYYFTSFTISSNVTLSFSSAVTVYCNGPASIGSNCMMVPYNYSTLNLIWYQAPSTSFTVSDNFYGGGKYVGPSANFIAHDNLYFGGAMMFNTITVNNSAQIYMDETLSAFSASPVTLVK